MKQLLLVFTITFFSVMSTAQTANPSTTQEGNDFIQNYHDLEKKTLTMEVLKIEDKEEQASFLKLYNEYEVKRKEIGVKRNALIEEYTSNFENIQDVTLIKLIDESSKLKIENLNLITEYYDKISRVVSTRQGVQFYQLENHLFSILSLQISDSLPFVKSLKTRQQDVETPAMK